MKKRNGYIVVYCFEWTFDDIVLAVVLLCLTKQAYSGG